MVNCGNYAHGHQHMVTSNTESACGIQVMIAINRLEYDFIDE